MWTCNRRDGCMLADEEGPIDLWGLLTPQVLLIIVIAILVVLALVAELGLLAREPDPAELNARLAAARARVGELGGAARRIRYAAAAARQGASDAGVAELTGDLDTELSALQAGVQALAQLDRPDRPGRQ